jgi:hypothetical protein
MPMPRRLLAAVLGAALLGACDSPSASEFKPTVSVTYGGAVSGRFSVTAPGGLQLSSGPTYSEELGADGSGFVTYSRSPAAAGRVDWITVIGPTTPGEYSFETNCSTRCYGVSVGLGHPSDDSAPQEGESGWILERGVITVRTPGADGHVRGTFSGSGQLHRFTGGKWLVLGQVTVTGKFETGLVPGQSGL